MEQIPNSWENFKLNELGEWRGGGTPAKSNVSFWNGNIPWVSPKDMKVSKIKDTLDHITSEAIENSSANLIPAGSILVVTRSGILAHSFPVATNYVDVTINQDLKALTPAYGVEPEFIAWMLRAFQRDILNKCSKYGTTVHSIEMPRFFSFKVPIAPTNEQIRIVSKIEELFSKIDEGERCLNAIAPIADKALGLAFSLRQSILKKAFTGQLVEQNTNDEPASVLLERIRAEKAAQTTSNKKNKKRKAAA